MRTWIVALTVAALTACAAQQNAGFTIDQFRRNVGCPDSDSYAQCQERNQAQYTEQSRQRQQQNPCDPTITDPYFIVDCPSRKAEADARIAEETRNNAMAARNQADLLYCNMQAQIASANVRGILYPAAVYGQVQNTCLQMKAAERAASNP